MKAGADHEAMGVSHDGSREKLPTTKILLQDNGDLLVGSRPTIPSRVLRMDGGVGHLAFQLSPSNKTS